jgi:hypothetical protein
MRQAIRPQAVLAALDEEVISPDGSISAATAVPATAAELPAADP